MRIAHFLLGRCNPDSANGVDKTVYHLSKLQAALGHDVAIFSLTEKSPFPIDRVEVVSYRPTRFPFRLPSGLVRRIREREPSLVHLHSSYIPQNVVLSYYLLRNEIPYVVTPNGGLSPYILKRRAYLKLPFKYLFERPYLNRAAFLHAVGEGEVADIERYGVTRPVVVAPNGIDFQSLPDDRDPSILAKKVPQVQGRRVFAFIGRLDPYQKGLDLLLEGFRRADKEVISDSVLLLIGPDWNNSRQRLENLAQRLGIADRVLFTGPVYGREKFDLLSGTDVFVHTSRWEGVPFALLEALACGKPCIASTATNVGRLVTAYHAGIVVNLSIEDIARALSYLGSRRPSDLAALGEGARELAATEFSWNRVVETLTEAYAQVNSSAMDNGQPANNR